MDSLFGGIDGIAYVLEMKLYPKRWTCVSKTLVKGSDKIFTSSRGWVMSVTCVFS